MSFKILVVSDSHRDTKGIEKAIENMGTYMDMMIHLGDSQLPESIIRGLTSKPVEMVRGNCDYDSKLPIAKLIDLGKHTALITHGHRYMCNYGTESMEEMAKENGADIVMFGHTHVPLIKKGEVTVVNPGSITNPRQDDRKKSYLVVTLEDDGRVDYMHVYL